MSDLTYIFGGLVGSQQKGRKDLLTDPGLFRWALRAEERKAIKISKRSEAKDLDILQLLQRGEG